MTGADAESTNLEKSLLQAIMQSVVFRCRSQMLSSKQYQQICYYPTCFLEDEKPEAAISQKLKPYTIEKSKTVGIRLLHQ